MAVPTFIRPGSTVTQYPAGTHNWSVRAVQELQAGRGIALEGSRSDYASTAIRVKNGTNSDIDKHFGILKISGPMNDPGDFDNEPYQGLRVSGEDPDDGTQFVVLQGSAAVNQSVEAVIFGPTWVRMEVVDEDHKFAVSVESNTETLKSAPAGVPIIWKETGAGTKWSIVLLTQTTPNTTIIFGEATAAVTGGDFTIDAVGIITGTDPRDDPTSTTETVSVENKHQFDSDINGVATCVQYDDPDASPQFYCLQLDCPA